MLKMKTALVFLVCLIMDNLFAQELSGRIEPGILYSVIDIDHNGTGFLVSRPSNKTTGRQFFLVTNKHMIGEWTPVDPFTLNKDIKFYLYSKDSGSAIVEVSLQLIDNRGQQSDKLKVHPIHKIDIAVIDITSEIDALYETKKLNLWSIDTSYLVPLKNITGQTSTGIGDQVFALGYPAGIKSSKTNQPIAKAGYISSSIDGDLEVLFPWKDKSGILKNTSAEGNFF